MSLERIEKLIRSQKFAQARKLLSTSSGLSKQDHANLMGVIALKEGQPHKARLFFEKALSLDSNILEFHANYGAALKEAGHSDQAISAYENLLKFEVANQPIILGNLAGCYVVNGQLEKARKTYLKALEKDPAHFESLLGLIGCLQQLAEKTKNKEDLEAARHSFNALPKTKLDRKKREKLEETFLRLSLLFLLDEPQENHVLKDAQSLLNLKDTNTLCLAGRAENQWDEQAPQIMRPHKNGVVLPGVKDWYVLEDGLLYLDDMENANPAQSPHIKALNDAKILLEMPKETLNVQEAFLMGGSPNYYHWLLDYLPRLRFLQDPNLPILTHKPSVPQQKVYDYLGIKADRILAVEGARTSFFVETLHAPLLSSHKSRLHPDALQWLRSRFLKTEQTQDKKHKIYISRTATGMRDVVNEKEIVPLLKQHDFDIIKAEKLTFFEQVHLFQNASFICGPHGAGLSNMVFSTDANILEISPAPGQGQDFFEQLAHSCGHRYQKLQAIGAPSHKQKNEIHANDYNMIIDPNMLSPALEALSRV